MLYLLSYSAMIIVLVGQLLCLHYLMSEEYNVITTVGYNKFSLESEDGEGELLYPKPCLFVFLLDVANTDLDQEENLQEDVLLNEIASADTFMVFLTLLSQAEVYSQGESILTVLLRLKFFYQEQPTQSVKGGAPNPYLALFTCYLKTWCAEALLVCYCLLLVQRAYSSDKNLVGGATRLISSDVKIYER